jgi:hypothetical protein
MVDTFGVCRDPQGQRCYFLSMGFLSMKFLDVCLHTLLLVVPRGPSFVIPFYFNKMARQMQKNYESEEQNCLATEKRWRIAHRRGSRSADVSVALKKSDKDTTMS